MEPPEPIPNSEVKRSSADGSVGFPHVRVGHRQALILKTLTGYPVRVFFRLEKMLVPSVSLSHEPKHHPSPAPVHLSNATA